MWIVSSSPMFDPLQAKITEGRKLKELLNRHKVVWNETEEVDEEGRFKSWSMTVGGNNDI